MADSGAMAVGGGVDDTMPQWRWWSAVLAGVTTPVLATPGGDLLPMPWRFGLAVALPLFAVLTGLLPTFRRALRPQGGATSPQGGTLLLALACLLGLVGGAAAFALSGQAALLSATGLAVAAHLLACRIGRGLLRALPGAGGPVAPLPAEAGNDPRRWAERLALWSFPVAAGVAAASAVLGLGGVLPLHDGLARALSALLTVSPAAFLLAREIPDRAARDRGRELGLVYGGVDIRRLSGVRSVVLGPEAVCGPYPRLVGVHPAGRLQVTAALQAAASVAAGSDEPVHRALVRAARERGLVLRPTHDVPAYGADTVDHASRPGLAPTRRARLKDTVVTVGPAEAFGRMPAELTGHQLYVGWGDTARAALDLVPQIRSEALTDRSEMGSSHLRPVLVGHDAVALRHVGEALEIPARDRRDLTGGVPTDVVEEYAETGPVLLLDSPVLHDAGLVPGETADVGTSTPGRAAAASGVEFAPVFRATAGLPTATDDLATGVGVEPDRRLLRTEKGDLTGVLRAVGLARKAVRVSTQTIVLAIAVQGLALAAAVTGFLRPEAAALLGAALPVLVTINGVRPRSYARSDETP
ncbi:hypothetical protein [Mobilicoccus pelagius]|uniref:Copper-transporting ATPase n=1 Tax=Mobilicoccus pelagius NBRC 104925 TaxID=1089455 RepID=H5UVT6_9MICO|nr:hypothetical protein [Mobilicoccus pelagius]GAB49844.1 copper-transporting ATPase [Mobilicoccus pelagius NBRC 104925]